MLVLAGLLERDGGRLHDAAVGLDEHGVLRLRQRRISPGWHGPRADPRVCGAGLDVGVWPTALGRLACLICGDLFDDRAVELARRRAPDLLVVPLLRSFAGGAGAQQRWDAEDLPLYQERVRQVGVRALVVHALDEDCFGGAWAFGPAGDLPAALPLGGRGGPLRRPLRAAPAHRRSHGVSPAVARAGVGGRRARSRRRPGAPSEPRRRAGGGGPRHPAPVRAGRP